MSGAVSRLRNEDGSLGVGRRASLDRTRPWVRLFLNPASGGRQAADQLPAIVAALEGSGLHVVASFTQVAQDHANEVAQAVASTLAVAWSLLRAAMASSARSPTAYGTPRCRWGSCHSAPTITSRAAWAS